MKSPIILLIALLSFTLSCSPNTGSTASPRPAAPTQAQLLEKEQPSSDAQAKKVSLSEADKAETTAEAVDRKILRNADITIEVASTAEAQHSVTSIAETRG